MEDSDGYPGSVLFHEFLRSNISSVGAFMVSNYHGRYTRIQLASSDIVLSCFMIASTNSIRR